MATRVSEVQVVVAYEVAARAFTGGITIAAGARQLHEQHGLNKNSARDFIDAYRHMLRGEVFQRGMSAAALDYFLSRSLSFRQRFRRKLPVLKPAKLKHMNAASSGQRKYVL